MRSLWSSVAVGFGESFFGPGSAATQGRSAASTGEPRPGTLRFSVSTDTTSVLAGGFNNGFLGVNANRISLHHIGSATTVQLAQSGMLDMAGGVGDAPFTSRWVLQTQTGSTGTLLNSSSAIIVTYPSAYSGIPFVWIGASSTSLLVGILGADISKTSFSSAWSFVGGSGASKTDNTAYYVLSLGTQAI